MNITLTLNGVDFSPKLSTYSFRREIKYRTVQVTLDNKERHIGKSNRAVLEFSMFPLKGVDVKTYYNALNANTIQGVCYDPTSHATVTLSFVLDSDISEAFALHSVDGNDYYKGTPIRLRGVQG